IIVGQQKSHSEGQKGDQIVALLC
ncbi:MAG: hypothetical protein RLZZ490_136, partial [Cyanobacteriota bacterium]